MYIPKKNGKNLYSLFFLGGKYEYWKYEKHDNIKRHSIKYGRRGNCYF